MNKISAVYQIINTVTGDRYVGSSKNVKRRWQAHKRPYVWKNNPNKQLYLDMQKYGLDKFRFQILAPVMEEYLKDVEQDFIDLLHPTYNNFNAKGRNVERLKETRRKAFRKYRQSDKYKQTNKGKGTRKRYMKGYMKRYNSRLCSYNGETLTLSTLYQRFRNAGIEHPALEAKKYLIEIQS